MSQSVKRLVRSWSNGRLLAVAREFASSYPEIIVIVPTPLAGEGIAHSACGAASGIAGLRRMTLVQLAADLARFSIAERGLAPLSTLGLEAVAARPFVT